MDIASNMGVDFKNHYGGAATEIKNTYTNWLKAGRFFFCPMKFLPWDFAPESYPSTPT